MTKFHFCITTGMDGYLPDNQEYVAADCAVDAYDAIMDALRFFQAGEEPSSIEIHNWKPFFERGCAAGDGSMWNFIIAHNSEGQFLSLAGLTEAEYLRESAP